MNTYLNWPLITLLCLGLSIAACGDNRTEEERVQAAIQSIEKQRYRDAIIELRNVLRINADNAQARVVLGNALLETGDIAAADKEYQRARELDAPFADYAEGWARVLQERNAHVEVLSEIDPQAVADPALASVLHALRARSMVALGSNAEAEAIFDAQLAAGQSVEAQRISLLGKASIAAAGGDFDKVESLLKQSIEIAPDSAESLLALGLIYLNQEKFQQVKELLEGAEDSGLRTRGMDRFMLVAQRAEALLGLNENAAAAEAASQLRDMAKDHPLSNYLSGRVELQSGNVDEAVRYFQDVLSRYPNFTKAQILMGAALLQQRDFEQAEMFLSNAVANNPGNTAARRLLAETRLRMNRPQDAIATVREGLQNDATNADLLTLLGRATVQMGNQDAGVEYLQNVLREQPDNLQAKLSLAAAYVAQGDGAQAVRILRSLPAGAIEEKRLKVLITSASFDRDDPQSMEADTDAILKEYPDDPFVLAVAGSFYVAANRLPKARAQFERLLELQPDSMSAMLSILRIDEREGDFSRSQKMFEAAHAKDSNELVHMMVLARIYKANGNSERSLAMVNKAYQVDPNALMPNLILAAESLATRDYVAMEQYATTAVTNHPQSARAQALMGVTQLRRSEFKAARESFARALEIEPNEFMYHYHLGNAQLGSSQLAQARDSYSRVLELKPDHLASIRSLAVLEVRAKNAARVEELLELAATQHGAQNANVLELVADVRAVQGRADDALAAFEKAQALQATWPRAAKMYQLLSNNKMPNPTAPLQAWVDKTPGDATARLMLAQGYQRAQQNTRAIEQYEAVVKLRPDSVLARNNLAWLYMESAGAGNLERARDQAAQAFQLAADNPDVADTYGWILFRIGEADKGIEILRKAVATAGPNQSPDIAYHLAAALNETGSSTEARELLTKALQSGGQFSSRADAQRLLDTL